VIINTSTNRPAPLMQDILNVTFGDIQWAICYPDGCFAIGLAAKNFNASELTKNFNASELYGRAMAQTRAWIMGDMDYKIVAHGWMKPRGVEAAGPVVVFRLPEVVSL
jgi:hypothetical protein